MNTQKNSLILKKSTKTGWLKTNADFKKINLKLKII